jgi:hypothetical protein
MISQVDHQPLKESQITPSPQYRRRDARQRPQRFPFLASSELKQPNDLNPHFLDKLPQKGNNLPQEGPSPLLQDDQRKYFADQEDPYLHDESPTDFDQDLPDLPDHDQIRESDLDQDQTDIDQNKETETDPLNQDLIDSDQRGLDQTDPDQTKEEIDPIDLHRATDQDPLNNDQTDISQDQSQMDTTDLDQIDLNPPKTNIDLLPKEIEIVPDLDHPDQSSKTFHSAPNDQTIDTNLSDKLIQEVRDPTDVHQAIKEVLAKEFHQKIPMMAPESQDLIPIEVLLVQGEEILTKEVTITELLQELRNKGHLG